MNEQAFSLTGMMTLVLRRVVLENKCVEGVDVYGSFLIGITLKDSNGNAELTPDDAVLAQLPKGNYTLVLTDITGTTWEQVVTK